MFITKQTNIASQYIIQWWLFTEIKVTTFALQGYNTLLLCTDLCFTQLGNYSSSMPRLISLWNFDHFAAISSLVLFLTYTEMDINTTQECETDKTL